MSIVDMNKIKDNYADITKNSPTHNTVVMDASLMGQEQRRTGIYRLLKELGTAEFDRLAGIYKIQIDKENAAAEAEKQKRMEQAAKLKAIEDGDHFHQYVKKFRYYGNDPTQVNEWMHTKTVEELQKLADKIEAKSLRYKSLFAGNTAQAITVLRNEISQRNK